MRSQILLFVGLLSVAAVSVAAQTKVVTNTDLEKFKLVRLKAEADYRENYARWGFPSPEELDRRREQSRIEAEQLSSKLRTDRLERERLDAEREASERRAAAYYQYGPVENEHQYGNPLYFPSYGRYRLNPIRHPHYQPGYFAGGHFWPTPIIRHVTPPMWIPHR